MLFPLIFWFRWANQELESLRGWLIHHKSCNKQMILLVFHLCFDNILINRNKPFGFFKHKTNVIAREPQ
jgi:hypothetical protein